MAALIYVIMYEVNMENQPSFRLVNIPEQCVLQELAKRLKLPEGQKKAVISLAPTRLRLFPVLHYNCAVEMVEQAINYIGIYSGDT